MLVPEKAGKVTDEFVAQVHRYEAGELTTHDLDSLIYRTQRKLNRACWCDEGVCCYVHGKHVTPHKRCMLK